MRCGCLYIPRGRGKCVVWLVGMVALISTGYYVYGADLLQTLGRTSRNLQQTDNIHSQNSPMQWKANFDSPGVSSRCGGYKHHPHLWRAERRPAEDHAVSITTFCTVTRLNWLPWLLQSWAGPLSVAVLAPRPDFPALVAAVNYLKKCYPSSMTRVSIHLAYPNHSVPDFNFIEDKSKNYACDDSGEEYGKLLGEYRVSANSTMEKLPQNQLRNLARRGSSTRFAIASDVDMIPNPLMYEELSNFLGSIGNSSKLTFVLPIYEVFAPDNRLPADKNTLLNMVHKDKARRYHFKVYKKNQGNSHLEKWEKGPNDPETNIKWTLYYPVDEGKPHDSGFKPISVVQPYTEMYKISTYEEYWEPIVVMDSSAPEFDERFVGFGFCRSSFHYLLHTLDYKYSVLDRPFFSHFEFQTLQTYPEFRKDEIKKNLARYKVFKKELAARYGPPKKSAKS